MIGIQQELVTRIVSPYVVCCEHNLGFVGTYIVCRFDRNEKTVSDPFYFTGSFCLLCARGIPLERYFLTLRCSSQVGNRLVGARLSCLNLLDHRKIIRASDNYIIITIFRNLLSHIHSRNTAGISNTCSIQNSIFRNSYVRTGRSLNAIRSLILRQRSRKRISIGLRHCTIRHNRTIAKDMISFPIVMSTDMGNIADIFGMSSSKITCPHNRVHCVVRIFQECSIIRTHRRTFKSRLNTKYCISTHTPIVVLAPIRIWR
ncbi:hypothetical protein Pgin04_01961 [Porphyromonas gingivalis]